MTKRLRRTVLAALLLIAVSPLFAPEFLAFPYVAQVDAHRVYSEAQLRPEVARAVIAGDTLAARSPLAAARVANQQIFLTNGGWRWTWLTEGYCNHVAGGGSLSDSDARALIAANEDHPALPYWLGRKRIDATLAHNGSSVDALFRSTGA